MARSNDAVGQGEYSYRGRHVAIGGIRRPALIIALTLVLTIVFILAAATLAFNWFYARRLQPGVLAMGIDLGGDVEAELSPLKFDKPFADVLTHLERTRHLPEHVCLRLGTSYVVETTYATRSVR